MLTPNALRLSLLVTAALGAAPAAQAVRLNPPFDLVDVVGDVSSFRVHPGGSEVVFRADARHDGSLELYRVPLAGGQAPLPVVSLGPGRSVGWFEFSADGQWLVYTANQDVVNEPGLYAHRVGVPGSRRLSAPADGRVESFELAGDGLTVVYVTELGNDVHRLRAAPLDGSAAPWLLSQGLASQAHVVRFELDLLGERAAYTVQQVSGKEDLFSVLLDGSAPPLTLATDVADSTFFTFKDTFHVSPDGARVVYRKDRAPLGSFELFSVPLDKSSNPVVLNAPLVAGGDVIDFRISADGARVAYSARQLDADRIEILSAPIDGSVAPVLLSGASIPNQNLLVWAADATRAFYIRLNAPGGLFSAPLDGSTSAVRLDGPDGKVHDPLFFSPDGTRVVYRVGIRNGGDLQPQELRSVPTDGSAPYAVLAGPTQGFEIRPDSTRVLYHEGSAVRSAPIDGSAPSVLITEHAGLAFGHTPDGTGALVVADADVTNRFELFAADAGTGAGLRKLSGALARGSASDVGRQGDLEAKAFTLGALAQRVAFTADAEVDEEYQLYSRRTDGAGPAPVLSPLGDVAELALTPDEQWAVYRFRPAGTTIDELWRARVDGAVAPARLHPPLAPGRTVREFRLSADGTRAAYVRAGGGGPVELWSVPLAAPNADILLAQGDELAFALAASSARAVYRARTAIEDRLYVAALDGSSAPLELDHVQISSDEFALSPDDSRVAYVALDGSEQLRSVPLDGSASAVVLSGSTRVLAPPRVSPDGQRVVFLGGPQTSRTQLYSAPLDGSAPAVVLNGPMVTDGWVRYYALSSDSARVVYTADQNTPIIMEFFSAPLDGSASAVRLNAPYVPGGGWYSSQSLVEDSFQITPDGTRVVYLVDQESAHVRELFVAPIDASAAPLKLSGPLPASADVWGPIALSPDSTRVVFAANPRGPLELYLSSLDGSSAALRVTPPSWGVGLASFEITADGERLVYQAIGRFGSGELFSLRLPRQPQDRHVQPR